MKNVNVILSAAIAAALLFLAGCDDDGVPLGTLDDLDVGVVSATIYANLMPMVPPDPIQCQLVLVARNTSSTATLAGLTMLAGELSFASSDTVLGSLSFAAPWDGRLNPGEADTVRLTKVGSHMMLSPPPCARFVDLRISVRDLRGASATVEIDSLLFGCVY